MSHYCNKPTASGRCRREVRSPGAPCGAAHRTAPSPAVGMRTPALVSATATVEPIGTRAAPGTELFLRNASSSPGVAERSRQEVRALEALIEADRSGGRNDDGVRALIVWKDVQQRFGQRHADATDRWLRRFHERHDRLVADGHGANATGEAATHEPLIAVAAAADHGVRHQVSTRDLDAGDVIYEPGAHMRSVGVVVDPDRINGRVRCVWVQPEGFTTAAGVGVVNGAPRPVTHLGNVHTSI